MMWVLSGFFSAWVELLLNCNRKKIQGQDDNAELIVQHVGRGPDKLDRAKSTPPNLVALTGLGISPVNKQHQTLSIRSNPGF